MESRPNRVSRDRPPATLRQRYGGLAAILIAIVLGVLVGVFYGRQMWIASGEISAYREQLENTLVQKDEFAAEAEEKAQRATDPAQRQALLDKAARLRGHKPRIQERLEEVRPLESSAVQAARLERLAEELAGVELSLAQAEGPRRAQLQAQQEALRQRIAEVEEHQEQAERREDAVTFTVAAIVAELTRFVGELFLQVLKLLVIPLVVTSMICGITSLGDVRKLGPMGGWTIFYFISTMAVAVLIGITLVLTIQPGAGADDTFSYVKESVQQKQDTTILETILNVFRGRPEEGAGGGMFPSNIFQAASDTNVLALIIFALIFGAALTTVGERGRTTIAFFEGANEAVMKMVHLVMFFAPVGIYGLVAWNIAKNGGGEAFYVEVKRLGWYVSTVLLGLSLHVVFLGAVLAIVGRRNPFTYFLGILRAILTAMTTASSSATLPVTMESVEENLGISNRSASFVLPLGATVNMDGTALYEAVAVIFIAQSLGMDLPLASLVIIFFTATLAAVGAAGIPEAGLVTMVIVLQAAGVPLSGIGTILAIDWFLDRMRTSVNVLGDTIGCAVVDEWVVNRAK